MKSFKQGKYEQALIETYLKFDELLRMEKVDEFLRQNSNATKNERNLNVKFISEESQAKQSETKQTQKRYDKSENSSSSNKSEHKSIELERIRIDDNTEILDNTRLSSSKLEINQAYTHNIEESIIERNYFSMSKTNSKCNSRDNSPKSIKTSEDSKSDDSIILNNQKLLLSRKKNSTDCIITGNYDGLIARDMGTTANILLVKNNQLFLANVGDSLAVLFKNGQAIRLNEEHKVTLPSELARINKSGARIINNRIEGRLNLTRAIGIYII
jgi:serine/threonine protein phosphatase PrpC